MRYDFNPDEKTKEAILNTVVYAGSFSDDESAKNLVIEEGIEEIAENAFRDFLSLEIVTLPKSLKKISACAFSGCKNLTRVDFGGGVSEICDEAFAFCSSLTTVIMPDSVKRIGDICDRC